MKKIFGLALIVSLFGLSAVYAADWYVSPAGPEEKRGNGSISNPWDLHTALCGGNGRIGSQVGSSGSYCITDVPATVQPGDTIYLRGGKHSGRFLVKLQGASGRPITITSYPGEWATIEFSDRLNKEYGFRIEGSYLIFRDLEFVGNWNGDRSVVPLNEWTDGADGVAFVVSPDSPLPGIKIINNYFHDLRQVSLDAPLATPLEFHGNIVQYNGWYRPGATTPRTGHGTYIDQDYIPGNKAGKIIDQNIYLRSFSVDAYIRSSPNTACSDACNGDTACIASCPAPKGRTHSITFKDNFVFGANGGDDAFRVTEATPAWELDIENNVVYGQTYVSGKTADDRTTNAFRYGIFTNNWLHTPPSSSVNRWQLYIMDSNVSNNAWIGSRYFLYDNMTPSASNRILDAMPQEFYVKTCRNRYEAGRVNIYVINGVGATNATIDLSALGYRPGDFYEIRDAQNFKGNAVRSGTYAGGNVTVPLTLTSVPVWDGYRPPPNSDPDIPSVFAPAHTPSTYNVFILRGKPSSPVVIYGDVSGDGNVSAYDAALAVQYTVGLITLTPEQITRGDVSGGGGVSAYDAALIAQYAVGLITKFPVQ